MSRAVNVNAKTVEVETLCDRHAIRISTMEELLSGGTRVVLVNADGAAALRKHMKTKLIEGQVKRSPFHVARHPAPERRTLAVRAKS